MLAHKIGTILLKDKYDKDKILNYSWKSVHCKYFIQLKVQEINTKKTNGMDKQVCGYGHEANTTNQTPHKRQSQMRDESKR